MIDRDRSRRPAATNPTDNCGCGADRLQWEKNNPPKIHLNVGSDIHWISVCGYAEREPAAKYAWSKEPVTCEWCKALILVAEAKLKDEIDRLREKSKTDAAEIHHLYSLLERGQNEARHYLERIAELEAVVELARKVVASRKVALQHGRANQAECDLAKALQAAKRT